MTLGICLVATSSILILVYSSLHHLSESFLLDELNAQKSIIAKSYVEPMWSFDQKQIEEVSNYFFKYNGFASMRALKVVDPQGNVLFYKTHGEEKNILFSDFNKLPFTKTAYSEVIKDGEVLGKVYMAFTTNGIMNDLRNHLGTIFLVSVLILTLTSLWVLVFFNRLLTAPFNKLLDHIKQIRNQNYDSKEYSPLPHEMQLISNALNFTSHLIRKRNEDLRSHSENLEIMVAERTQELESQIIKNINASRLVAVGEVASGIAHEINNPLTVINGQVSKLKRQVKGSEKEQESEASLLKISMMSERIVKIINGLKLISRDGHNDPMVDFSLAELIDEIRLLTEMKIRSLNINFQINVDPSLEMAHGREVQISQVIVNLVNNSVDAISNLPEKWIVIKVIDQFQFIEFRITDSGAGIDTDLKEKIMQPFFTTKEVGKGTGLGLSISKSIISEHGGDFYYNDKSQNTEFVFTIQKSIAKINAA